MRRRRRSPSRRRCSTSLNHSLFKSLLFFGAGAVLTATGERDMERLGGLIHSMPQTAFVVLGGCVAISALPPLNGFVSEWLIFQAILISPAPAAMGAQAHGAGGRRHAGAGGGAVGGLLRPRLRRPLPRPAAIAGRSATRSTVVSRAPPWSSLPVLCLAAGIVPGFVIDALAPVTQRAGRPSACRHRPAIRWLSIVPVAESRSSYNGLLVFVFIAVSTLARGRDHPPLRVACRAARSGLGLRLPRPQSGDAIHRRQLCPADPPRLRPGGLSRARARRHARARDVRPRASRSRCATSSGTALYVPIADAIGSQPRSSTICSS